MSQNVTSSYDNYIKKKVGMNKMTNELINIVKDDDIAKKIFICRGIQVMLDSDIAFFFEIEIKRLNQQMKRNIERFPEDFCFQLNSKEFKSQRFQNATFK